MDDLIPGASPLRGLPIIQPFRRCRASSWDRTGANSDFVTIPPGEAAVLADIKGAGLITHIWNTARSEEPHFLRKVLLRMFWDGEKAPSVLAPVGDFFGMGHAITRNFISLPLQMSPADGHGFNSFFPMPFSKGARIEALNEGSEQVKWFFWYIDYEQHQSIPANLGRFHAQWRRENPTEAVNPPQSREKSNLDGRDNYILLEAEGHGHYVGCNLNVDTRNSQWYGEGDDMMFIDADELPSIVGTGTEDYFANSWGSREEYSAPYHGLPLVNYREPRNWTGKHSMYRFHIDDPVYFHKSIKVTIEHGHANALANDYSSTAYWYQAEPHKPFGILPASQRIPWED